MDCQTARQWIDLLPASSRDWESAEGALVRDHLASCSLCREVTDDLLEFDGRVAALLPEVAIPEGLRDRVLAQLQKAAPRVEAAPAGRKWASRLVSLGLTLMVAVGGWYWATRPAQMSTARLGDSAAEVLLGATPPQVAFDGSFRAQISDPRWQRVAASQPVGWDLDGRAGHDVAAFRVNIASLRFRGWLVMIPVSRVSDVPNHSDPVRLNYSRCAVWGDQKFVYLCIAEQGSIEDLIDQWGTGAA